MQKHAGFTLIEILTVVTILGILFLITVPEYRIIRDKNEFRAQNQAVWDQVATARSAALSNKKCPDDSIAALWQVVIAGVDNSGDVTHTLNCIDVGDNVVNLEPTKILGQTALDALQVNSTSISTDPEFTASTIEGLNINFLSGSAQVRLEQLSPSLASPDDIVRIENLRIVMGHTNSPLQQTLCLERVSGFPTINKNGSVCEEDVPVS